MGFRDNEYMQVREFEAIERMADQLTELNHHLAYQATAPQATASHVRAPAIPEPSIWPQVVTYMAVMLALGFFVSPLFLPLIIAVVPALGVYWWRRVRV